MELALANGRVIGEGHPVFIIAEVGNNHQGSIELALTSIDHAAAAGADAVSFQYAPIASYCTRDMYDDPRVAFLNDVEFSIEQLQGLRARASKHGLAFSINVEDAPTLDVVLGVGMEFIKLCSADLTNLPFIQYASSRKMPVFFSTGGAYLEEIELACNAMKAAGLAEYVVYHTNSGYPTPIEQANLLQMDLLHGRFGGLKGYCDHTVDLLPPLVAAARGAHVIEKHITTNRELRGDDWMVSLEPAEFHHMVEQIRDVEKTLGTEEKKPLEIEESTRVFKRKSIVSRVRIPKGAVLVEEMLAYKIPGTGISPVEQSRVLGLVAAMDIDEDVLVEPHMLEGWE